MKVIEIKWSCGDCGQLRYHSLDAALCCAPAAKIKYLCPDCGAAHDHEYKARECCGEES